MNSSPELRPDLGALVFYRKIALAIGNGDLEKGIYLLDTFAKALNAARSKHPIFAEGSFHALGVIGAEYNELCHAVEKETQQREMEEALDLMVTASRFVAGEHNIKLE